MKFTAIRGVQLRPGKAGGGRSQSGSEDSWAAGGETSYVRAMTFALAYTKQAGKALDKLSLTTVLRILAGCERLKTKPFPDGTHIKKLEGYKDLYRLRVVDLRIVFTIKRSTVTVLGVISMKDVQKAYLPRVREGGNLSRGDSGTFVPLESPGRPGWPSQWRNDGPDSSGVTGRRPSSETSRSGRPGARPKAIPTGAPDVGRSTSSARRPWRRDCGGRSRGVPTRSRR